MRTSFYSRQQLEAMTIERLRLIDIKEMDEELLVQEVLNAKVQAAPPTGDVYRGDIPDIKTPEDEAKYQAIIDARTAAATGGEIDLPNADKVELPPETAPESPQEPEKAPVQPEVAPEPTTEPVAPDSAPDAPQKHVITQDDLDTNPGLVAEGLKVGDEVELPPVVGDTKDDSPQRFCDFCDSKGGFHKKDCPTKTVA